MNIIEIAIGKDHNISKIEIRNGANAADFMGIIGCSIEQIRYDTGYSYEKIFEDLKEMMKNARKRDLERH